MQGAPVLQRDDFFIGGEWRRPQGTGRIDLISPATEEVIGAAPDADTGDVDAAVSAARWAFDAGEWPRLPVAGRLAVLERAIQKLEPKAGEIAAAVTAEMGVPIAIAEQLIPGAFWTARYLWAWPP